MSPSTVSAPAFLAVMLEISSRDPNAHQVVVGTPTRHRLNLPAHGHVSLLLPGLKAGQYAIEIDGATRARLLIGGEPGP